MTSFVSTFLVSLFLLAGSEDFYGGYGTSSSIEKSLLEASQRRFGHQRRLRGSEHSLLLRISSHDELAYFVLYIPSCVGLVYLKSYKNF